MKLRIILALFIAIICIAPSAKSQSFITPSGGAIPDNNTMVCFPFTVSGLPAQIDSWFGLTSVCLDISHTYTADLKIFLRSPDNTIITLVSNTGGSGDNFTSTCLQEDGTSGWIVSGAAPFTGSYIPDQSLNIFNNGMNPNGTWEICILDEVPSDAGFLNFAAINFGNNTTHDAGLSQGV